MTYPNGKAIHDAMISKSRYSLKNKFRIVPILAPLTLRIAISLRRCSHDKVTKEKMPNTAIAIHIKETILNSIFKEFSDFMYSSYFSSILIKRNSAFGLTL